jgi:hypothetical protein
MFCRITLLSTVALLCIGALVFVAFVQPHIGDEAQYEKFMHRRPSMQPHKMVQQTAAHQVRTGVQKDFWTTHQGHPSHIRLNSVHSDLWIQPCKGKFEITEHLESIVCCEQELLKETNQEIRQEIRWLIAKQGAFSYPSSAFEAKEATLQIFSLVGNEFPESVPTTPPHSTVSSDLASWVWPEALHLTGNVRLFSEKATDGKTYALADELFFHPTKRNLELRSNAPQKVLLWQNDMRLSSPSIVITKDPIHKTEQIKGIGDVHFHFNGEEEAMFHKIFGIKAL